MSTKRVTATTVAAALASETPNAVIKPTGLKVDNKSAQDVTVKLEDSFSTVACKTTAGADHAAETLTTTSRIGKLPVTVKAGQSISLGEDDLKDIKFIGDMYHVEDVIESDCVIVVQFHTE